MSEDKRMTLKKLLLTSLQGVVAAGMLSSGGLSSPFTTAEAQATGSRAYSGQAAANGMEVNARIPPGFFDIVWEQIIWADYCNPSPCCW